MTISNIPERVSRLAGLLAREREALAQFISELAEFDVQRCWESLGYPSLFEFLTRELRLSRGAAFYRTKAVGLVQQFPEVLQALHDGKLCLSSVPEVARVLTEANRAEMLPRFFYLSREDAKLLSVEIAPRDVVPVREIVSAVRSTVAAAPSGPALALAPQIAPVQLLNADDPKALDRTGQSPQPPSPPLPSETFEPLTGKLGRLHLTISHELRAKLEAARLALSHARPGATIADLLELGADTAIAQDAKRKRLVKRPRARRADAPAPPSASDHVPAEVRRAVWKRDQGCCQWKLANGEICGSKFRLQYDHIKPRAQGGQTTIGNVRLLCQRHNLLAARQAYGEDLIGKYRRGLVGPQPLRSRPGVPTTPTLPFRLDRSEAP